MKKIDQKVIKFIDEKGLIQEGDKILVALSGGPDSVFLLNFLSKYKERFKIEIGAVHINHLLRGKEAVEDENFCRRLANDFGIPFYASVKNVKSFAKKNKISIEEAGRKIRYSEFERISKKYGYNKIATAHNCNDNAETVLLNLIKGAGLRGISGIPFKRGNIIRPVISLTKEEILSYLEQNKINYRTDPSNLDSSYERNFLRNQIIPAIKEKLNPSFEETLLHSSEIFKDSNSYIQSVISNSFDSVVKYRDGELKLSIESLHASVKEIRAEFIKLGIEKYFLIQPTFIDLKKILHLIEKHAGEKEELSQNLSAIRERNVILIHRNEKPKVEITIKLNLGKSINVNGKDFSIKKIINTSPVYTSNKMKEYISGDKIKSSFTIRKWKPGDKFYPLGMKGTKNISDFLAEQKIPSSKKKDQLVLTNGNKIVWVVGLRIDDRFKITNNTKKVYELCMN
ncbi:MAG TPA: tRNA lysidine(34) synthetase TilS [Ignavibacteriaceae bacterium]|nr:tRNA lysidine(34) synthetase TilS [Ignavibacteriaceae bacterium]